MNDNSNVQKLLLGLVGGMLVLSLLGCGSGNVVQRVSDGDTLSVTDANGKNFTVRFACVDAPEVPHSTKERNSKRAADRNQFKWGTKAQDRVKQLVKQGGDRVTLTITDRDRYGRSIAEVRLNNGTLVQEILAREGLALAYRPYFKNCPSASAIEQAETEAKQNRRGVWSDSQFMKPWEYRKFN